MLNVGQFANPSKSRLEQRYQWRALFRWQGSKIAFTADWTSLWPANVAWAIVWVPISIMAALNQKFLPPPTPSPTHPPPIPPLHYAVLTLVHA